MGAWLHLPGSASAELIGSVGFDFACVDLQHGVIDDDAVLPMLQALAATDTPSLVRVQTNTPESICRALDRGADGVIVPARELRGRGRRGRRRLPPPAARHPQLRPRPRAVAPAARGAGVRRDGRDP